MYKRQLYLQDKQYSAEVASARIQYQQSLEDYNRRVPLAKQGVISKETLEHTKDTLISSKAALNAAIQAYKANKALVMNTPLNLSLIHIYAMVRGPLSEILLC